MNCHHISTLRRSRESGYWPQWCATAFANLNKPDVDADSLRVALLTDIQQIFAGRWPLPPDGVSPSPVERVFSRYLTEQLAQMSERPWSEVCRGRPINERWLARTLGAFGIRSENIRIDEKQAKGYEKADFEDTFARYLPETGFLSVPPSRYEGKPPKSIRPKKENGTDEKSAPYIGKWDAGTDKKTGNAKTRALERPLIREAVEVFNGKIVT